MAAPKNFGAVFFCKNVRRGLPPRAWRWSHPSRPGTTWQLSMLAASRSHKRLPMSFCPASGGSRFVTLQLCRLAAGGSRERLPMSIAAQRLGVWRCHIGGSLRQPPAFTFLGQARNTRNIAGFSRVRFKAAPLRALGDAGASGISRVFLHVPRRRPSRRHGEFYNRVAADPSILEKPVLPKNGYAFSGRAG